MFHSSSSDRPISPPYYVSNSKHIINNGATLMPITRFASANFGPPILQAAAWQFRQLPLPPQPFLPLNQSLPPNYFSPHHQFYPPQPPLLPLPISKPQSNAKTISDPPAFTRKKSKKKSKNPCKEENLKSDNTKVSSSLLGLPKHKLPNNNKVSQNVISTKSVVGYVKEIAEGQYDVVDNKFAGGGCDGAVFTLSPPPSSLPLPTFSLRPKLRYAAPAAGIDSGAT